MSSLSLLFSLSLRLKMNPYLTSSSVKEALETSKQDALDTMEAILTLDLYVIELRHYALSIAEEPCSKIPTKV